MFILDDLLLRSLGLSIKPFDMIWILELMRNYALMEKYNVKKISNQIKENRLLFEVGELTEKSYQEKHKQLLEELNNTQEILEELNQNIKIREGI